MLPHRFLRPQKLKMIDTHSYEHLSMFTFNFVRIRCMVYSVVYEIIMDGTNKVMNKKSIINATSIVKLKGIDLKLQSFLALCILRQEREVCHDYLCFCAKCNKVQFRLWD